MTDFVDSAFTLVRFALGHWRNLILVTFGNHVHQDV